MRKLLRLLYGLQTIDTNLDDMEELRGDLPETVRQLTASISDLDARIGSIDTFLKQGALDREKKEKETLELLEKIDKYKTQQLKVRTNREYDALTREIDGANETIRIYEEEIEQYAGQAQARRSEREELAAQKEILEEELREKQKELDEITATTDKEERALLKEREKLVANLEAEEIERYNRIRDAKKGKVVVVIRRGSCSGCYNIVPPQLILQIRRNDEVYLCEHCGRILISEELTQDSAPLL